MAEYYAVLKKAVGGLESGSAEARRAVYDKARNALIGQLKAIDPPLAASEISRQRLELEEAIRRVERETAAEAQAPRYERPAEREPPPPMAPEPPPPSSSGPPPQSANQRSPQDIFRRAIQDAETRGGGSSPVERAPARAGGPQGGYSRPEYRTEPRQPDARLAPDYDNDWQSRGAPSSMPPDPYVDRQERSRPSGGGRKRDYLEEDDAELIDRTARPSRLPTILLFVLILGMIGGLAALGWSQRAVIADLLGGIGDGSTTGEATPPQTPAAPQAGDTASKSGDRLSGEPGGDPSVRVVEPREGTPPQAGSDAIADAIEGTPEAGSSDALVAQRAVLYEEPLDAATAVAGVTAIEAVVTWRFVESGANGPEIEANLEVPERGMKIRLSIRRNNDSTLPASHLVEAVVDTPADFPGKGVRSIPRLVFKLSEDERGLPLIGAAAKVADGFFWIALSSAQADIQQNLQLMRERLWIDLPIVYQSNQRAILTFEKGTPGDRVFQRAFAAWGTG
jgi:hypothetical protein